MALLSNKIRIEVNRSTEPVEATPVAETTLSPSMYIAGLIASEAGMYAVTYDMPDSSMGLVMRVLVAVGYLVSYVLRRKKIDLRQYQAPLLVVFATAMYFVATTAPNMTLGSATTGSARPYQIQIVIVWIAILQSFTLCSDPAILFACVPSMALLGIMSSGTPDDEVQYAFMVFLAATTFLMIHDNHLRMVGKMKRHGAKIASTKKDSGLFSGEALLVGACVISTIVIANFVAAPIQVVGRAILPINPSELGKDKSKTNASTPFLRVDEGIALDLGMGPRTQSDAQLLQVTSTVPVTYIRGTTYDYYAGNRFEDHLPAPQPISPSQESSRDPAAADHDASGGNHRDPVQNLFKFDPLRWDIGTGKMANARECEQIVRILGGSQTHLYGTPSFSSVTTPFSTLLLSQAGGLAVETSLVQDFVYKISSLIPSDNPDQLKTAGDAYPPEITSTYLQLPTPRSTSLQTIANEMTAGKTNAYDRVVALKEGIAKRCNYSLQAPAVARDRDVVEAFLTDSKLGYCDSFAAALTVLCRYAGIPARVASGFLTGDKQPDGTYIVREKHKHVWTEVYFPNTGWLPFDATDGAVDVAQTTTTKNQNTQPIFRWLMLHGPLPPLMAITIVCLVGYLINTEILSKLKQSRNLAGIYATLPAPNMEIVAAYTSICSKLAAHGLPRAPSMTPLEYQVHLSKSAAIKPELTTLVDQMTTLHQRYSYGSSVATVKDVDEAKRLITSLSAVLRTLPRSKS